MNHTRREFIQQSALGGTAMLIPAGPWFCAHGDRTQGGSPRMTLTFRPYTLQLRHVFTLATSS